MLYKKCIIEHAFVRRIDAAQLVWFGHVQQMTNQRLVMVVYDINVNRARLKGSLKLVWLNVMRKRKTRMINIESFCIIKRISLN